MDKTPQEIDEGEADRTDALRAAITSADATGLIAGEELITEAETIVPLSPQEHGDPAPRKQ